MATPLALPEPIHPPLRLNKIAAFPGLRALAWDGDILCASRGYTLLKMRARSPRLEWTPVARYQPAWWRRLTSGSRLSHRLMRDGFHGLAVHPGGNLIAAVPGAIVTLRRGENDFQVSHKILRGTRPLHITCTPEGRTYWGEYFDNAQRDEVYIYVSEDEGLHWEVAHAFPRGAIRHVHNIAYDRWQKCLWIFTGDYGKECRILRALPDFTEVEVVIAGDQQARAVAVVVDEDGLFFASDTPLEKNHLYHMDRKGRVEPRCELPSSSIYGCRTRGGMFFSTMIEPSAVNLSREVTVFGGSNGFRWDVVATCRQV